MIALAGLVNLKWAGKEKVLAKWDGKVQSLEQYLIFVNLEAGGKKTRLGDIITSVKTNTPLGKDKEGGAQPKSGKADNALNESQQAMQLSDIVNSLRGWNSHNAIPYLEQVADNGPRVARMEVTRALRKFENNRRAIDLAIRLLDGAKDDRERRENATTLGYIDNGRSLARLHELMLQSEDEDMKLTLAWAILNINRGHPASNKGR